MQVSAQGHWDYEHDISGLCAMPAQSPSTASLVACARLDMDALHIILDEMMSDACAHSWRRYVTRSGEIQCQAVSDLIEHENKLRPTTFFTYYIMNGGRREVVGVATVAERIDMAFPHDGFPVIARSFIRHRYRGYGLYRAMLQHRIDYCLDFFGARLRGVHLGTKHPAVRHVASRLTGPVSNFAHIGYESLDLGTETELMPDYLAFAPHFAEQLILRAQAVARRAGTLDAARLVELAQQLPAQGLGERGYGRLLAIVDGLRSSTGMDLTDASTGGPWTELLDFFASIPLTVEQ